MRKKIKIVSLKEINYHLASSPFYKQPSVYLGTSKILRYKLIIFQVLYTFIFESFKKVFFSLLSLDWDNCIF